MTQQNAAATDVPALTFVQAPDGPTTFNVLLYGAAKSGKSTAAATAPGPIMWVSAEGAGALGYARKMARSRGTTIHEVSVKRGVDTRALLRMVIEHVRSGASPVVRTVVVDTLAKVRAALIREIVVAGAKNSIQQFGEVATILKEFVEIMRDEPVNLVLIAHQDVADADGDRIVRPLIGGALTEFIPGEVDVIAYTHAYKDEESGERQYVGQLVEGRGRIAGDRSGGLGTVRPLDLTEWLNTYRAALAPDDSDLPWSNEPSLTGTNTDTATTEQSSADALADAQPAAPSHDTATRDLAELLRVEDDWQGLRVEADKLMRVRKINPQRRLKELTVRGNTDVGLVELIAEVSRAIEHGKTVNVS
jgi:AAA domain